MSRGLMLSNARNRFNLLYLVYNTLGRVVGFYDSTSGEGRYILRFAKNSRPVFDEVDHGREFTQLHAGYGQKMISVKSLMLRDDYWALDNLMIKKGCPHSLEFLVRKGG